MAKRRIFDDLMEGVAAMKTHRLLDTAARAEANEGIRQGLEDVRKKRTRPAREFFREFEARHGIRR